MKRAWHLMLVLLCSCGAPQARHTAALGPAETRMARLFAEACAGCHSDPQPAAGLRYDTLDRVRGAPRPAALQLAARTMPPPTAAQPTDDERREMIAWLEAASPALSPSPGGGTP